MPNPNNQADAKVNEAAPDGWHFEVPPATKRAQPLHLLTIGGVAVVGKWHGALGEYFTGWAQPLKIPKVTNGVRQTR